MIAIVRPTAYDEGKRVEQRGLQLLSPWLSLVADGGRWMWIAKSGMAELIQRAGADILILGPANTDWALDCKFLEASRDAPFEIWSDLRLLPGFTKHDYAVADDAKYMIDHRVSTRGWGVTSRADLILVYNIAADDGVIGRLSAWRELLVRRAPSGLRYWQLYQRREQGKRRQRNSSWVFWTPYAHLEKEAGFLRFNARQLSLWDKPELILQLLASAP